MLTDGRRERGVFPGEEMSVLPECAEEWSRRRYKADVSQRIALTRLGIVCNRVDKTIISFHKPRKITIYTDAKLVSTRAIV